MASLLCRSEVAVRSPIAEVRWTTLVPRQFIYRIYLVKADCASERHSRTAGLASSDVDQVTRPAEVAPQRSAALCNCCWSATRYR